MERYFSLALTSGGFLSAFNTVYKNDPSSRVFVVRDGTDGERFAFFQRLIKNLRGYSLTLFNPFYEESPNGIYIRALNTYIISGGGYARTSVVLPEEWEHSVSISPPKKYGVALRREILREKAAENACYKKACRALRSAGAVRERLHGEAAPFLCEEKLINYLKRFCCRVLRPAQQRGGAEVRLLSSPMPLGIHTHYETVFESCEKTLSIRDDTGFASAVLLGIIKDYAASEHIPYYMSPSLYFTNIPRFLLFPTLGLCLAAEDEAHPLPYSADEVCGAKRFLKNQGEKIKNKTEILLKAESRLLDSCVMSVFEGGEHRMKYNAETERYSDTSAAEDAADALTREIL